jgi:hypothetical protein
MPVVVFIPRPFNLTYMIDLNSLFEQQMAQWPECRARYDQLSNAGRRSITSMAVNMF